MADDVTVVLLGFTIVLVVTVCLDGVVVAGPDVAGRVVVAEGLLVVVGVTVRLEVDEEVEGLAVALLFV